MVKKILYLFIILFAVPSVYSAGIKDGHRCTRDTFFPSAGNCGYDVLDYLLKMAWTPDGDHWDVTEVITFISEWDTNMLWFDFIDAYDITELSVNGTVVEYDRKDTKLGIRYPFANGTRYQLYASFNGKLQWGEQLSNPTGENRDPADGFFMDNEPAFAMHYYICNDHPKDKATYHYSLTVPANYVPAGIGRLLKIKEANGNVIEPSGNYERDWDPEAAEGTVTFTYAQEYQTAPYLFTVAAGAFDMKQKTLDSGKVRLDFVDREHPARELAWNIADRQEEVIEVLERFFGPYPYEDLGGIFLKIEHDNSLETQGRPIYSGAFFITEELALNILTHEIAHQWIGDLISLEDWSDLWIKEGGATYGEMLWFEHENEEDYQWAVSIAYEAVANGLIEEYPVDEETLEFFKEYAEQPADTRYSHAAAVRSIANFCQIDREEVRLEDGDVTLDEWGDGLAESCEWVLVSDRSLEPFFEMIGRSTEELYLDGYTFGPKETPAGDIEALYDIQNYNGGALIFHILRNKLGDEIFIRGLQTLIEENREEGTVNEKKFIEVFSRAAGEDLTDFIKPFLYYRELGHIPDLPGGTWEGKTWQETRAMFER